jgi:hypothetical protein
MNQYYLHDGHIQTGPFSVEELKKQLVKPSTLVWYEGIGEWTKAGELEELKGLFKAGPPPIPSPSKPAPARSVSRPATEKKSFDWKALRWAVGVVLIVYVGFAICQKQAEGKTSIRDHIRDYVSAGNSAYSINRLGGIYGLNITINNRSEYMIDNVRVLIRYIKANGETWKEENLDFALIAPSTEMTLKAPDSDRGTSVDYKIISISSKALGL